MMRTEGFGDFLKPIDPAKTAQDTATEALHDQPCPGCGMEPEVRHYWRRKSDKIRVGYECGCGAVVIHGILQGYGRP